MGAESYMEKELDDVINQRGLDEAMEKLSGLFVDNFMIKGEITENLQEILQMAPDSLIDLILEKIMDQTMTIPTDRVHKEEMLYENILNYFQECLFYIEPDKLKLLIRLMNNQLIGMEETIILQGEFSTKGWVFTFVENDSCVFVVPNEIKKIIWTIEEDDVKEQYAFICAVRYVVNICMGLYGICKKEQIRNVYQDILSLDENAGELELFERYFDTILSKFENQEELWRDGEYIISNYLEDKKEYHALLNIQSKDYYLPKDESLNSYGLGEYVEKNREYATVTKLLAKEIRDVDQAEEMIEEISGYVIREDWDIPQVMNCLYDWDVAFASEKSAGRFTAALSEWLYGIRRWSECGHSRKELGKQNTDLKYIMGTKDQVCAKHMDYKKVYPNDPCPCGSGKKYKKCCGK